MHRARRPTGYKVQRQAGQSPGMMGEVWTSTDLMLPLNSRDLDPSGIVQAMLLTSASTSVATAAHITVRSNWLSAASAWASCSLASRPSFGP